MKKIILSIPALLLSASLHAAELKTLHQKTLYALGLEIAQEYAIKKNEVEYIQMGLTDAIADKSQIKLDSVKGRIPILKRERQAEISANFLEKAAKAPGAHKFPSGLIYKEIKRGEGEKPKATDTVRAHYHGTLTNGTVFDSSVKRGQPFVAPLNRVIPCWTEGMQMMKEGGKAQLICPSNIAYGERGHPPVIPGGATLIFDVELLAVNP